MAKKGWKILRNVAIGILAFILVLLVALQILLRPSVLTGLVNKYAPQFTEGNIEFSRIRTRLVKSFPYASVEAEDLSITYPHERYARFDSVYPPSGSRFSLMKAGNQRGEENGTDTLASARRVFVSLNYVNLAKGQIDIRSVELERPRIFAHYFDSTAANWDIFPSGGEEEDTTSSGMADIKLHKVSLTGKPFIVYTNPVDTVHLALRAKSLELDGKLPLADIWKTNATLDVDSLFVSGRLPADTLALGLTNLDVDAAKRRVKLDASATAMLRTNSFGRLRVPIRLDGDATFPKAAEGEFAANVHSLTVGLSALEVKAKGDLLSHREGLDMDVDASIEDCPLGDLIKEYRNNIPFLKKIDTDAIISLDAHAEGTLSKEEMPAINAKLLIPQSVVDIQGVGRSGKLALDAEVVTDNNSRMDASVHKLMADIAGAKINVTGNVWDILGEDLEMAVDGTVRARVDSLTRAFLDGISGEGIIKGDIHGKAKLSQLNLKEIGNANIDCDLTGENLRVDMPKDSVHAFVKNIALNAATAGNKIDKSIRQGARVLALKANIDTLNVTYGADVFARGSNLRILAQNSADILKGGKELTPLMGILKVDRLSLKDLDGVEMALRGNTERFRILPPEKGEKSPLIKLTSESEGIAAIMDGNAFALKNMVANIQARKHITNEKSNKERRNRLLDSLQRVYPGTPRDSLFRKARMERIARELRDDFASADVMLSMSKSSQQMARQWDFTGSLGLDLVRAYIKDFPLNPEITDIKGDFSNDKIDLENLTVTAGQSDLSASANVSGIRRLLTGRGKPYIKADANITSDYIDANELLRAYAQFAQAQAADSTWAQPADTTSESIAGTNLIVLPSNVEANVMLEGHGIKYDSLMVNWIAGDIAMRDRTIQITNALAASNMGDLYVEGFYATRAKDDIKAGFDLNIVDISAEKVLTLFPDVKKEMPIMNSFSGDLDMEVAATTEIDTTMNLILPTVDGIMRFTGSQLALKDSKEFTKIAKLLLFKDNTKAVIDNMSVAGMIRDNTVEVFPFVLAVDRYMLAASGVQSLDESFKYHISVIRSPLVVKFGLNAWGEDFDHIKYGLCKPLYTTPNVPVFTKQLDTVQYNLVAAIHNVFELGVEKAIAENTGQNFIQEGKARAGFNVQIDTTAMDDIIMAQMQNMEGLTGDVVERVAARRDILRQEVLALEEKYAAPVPAEAEKKDD
ncbi:MAG: hypothetical protein J6Y66_08045 [Bacteroidales bacterium]|nr:hypothetical protein [Bacteroidales bacterium]